jgi:hypothetical protein
MRDGFYQRGANALAACLGGHPHGDQTAGVSEMVVVSSPHEAHVTAAMDSHKRRKVLQLALPDFRWSSFGFLQGCPKGIGGFSQSTKAYHAKTLSIARQ